MPGTAARRRSGGAAVVQSHLLRWAVVDGALCRLLPGARALRQAPIETAPIAGCEGLDFSPTLQLSPTSSVADSPTGLHVDLHIPQQPSIKDPARPRESDLKDTVVTLPQGLTINPASAGGLEACSSQQIGLTSAVGVSPATFSGAPAGCPEASKVGTVEVDTPLLSEEHEGQVTEEAGRPVPHVLHGSVYIASPYENPFGSLFAIYVAVEDSQTGV